MLLLSVIILAFNVQPVKADAQIVYINADGSISPSGAPIVTSDKTTYSFTGDIAYPTYSGIVVQRSNVIIDGEGYTVRGNGGDGLNLTSLSNVTIENTYAEGFWYGIHLYSSSNNVVSGNNIATNAIGGIEFDDSSNTSISGNNITNSPYGIYLNSSSSNSISGNNITNNGDASIYLGSSSSNNVSGNNITNNGDDGIDLVSSSNNSISGNTFIGCGLFVGDSYENLVTLNTVNGKPLVYLEGAKNYNVNEAGQVILVSCDSIKVENLNLSMATVGVELWETNDSVISQNNINASSDYGIDLWSSSSNSISGNNVTNNWVGIYLNSSSSNDISGNNITNSTFGIGIYLEGSSSTGISGNNITNNDYGIYLEGSSSTGISGNNITNNDYGIGLRGSSSNSISGNNVRANSGYGIWLYLSSGNNSISGNNITNNGDYGIYLEGSSSTSISANNITSSGRDGIDLVSSSSNDSISGNNITNNDRGIYLGSSSSDSIVENNITANNGDYGIDLSSSSNNSISRNNIAANNPGGIYLSSSSSNNMSGNNVTNNGDGIDLEYSSSSDIDGNNITANNDLGITLGSSSNNSIYHNNLVNNTHQAYESNSSMNTWDDGYPAGGNYWSDYLTRYPDASEIDSSGIGNTSYVIDSNNTDHYPLMHPYQLLAPQYGLLVEVSGSGTANATGVQTYNAGTVVSVQATASAGWLLDHWLLNDTNVGSANPYTLTMNTNYNLTAIFTQAPPVQWTLTVGVRGSGTTNATGSQTYNNGTLVSVQATVSAGWLLDHWLLNDSNVGSVNPYTLTMNANYNLTAVFTAIPPVQWTLAVVSAHGSPNPSVGNYTYADGSSVICSVTSPIIENSVSYTCAGWTGTGSVPSSGTGLSTTFTISQNSTITWNWKTQYYLTVLSAYDSPSPSGGWFDSGTSITETVTSPVSGATGTQYVCTGWRGGGSAPASGSALSVNFTITQPSSVTWNWNTQYYLTVNSAHDTPGGAGWYDSGSTAYATLSSGTDSGGSGVRYVFTDWTGDASGSGLTSSPITMNGPMTATANWKTQYYLTVVSAYDSASPVSGWFDSGSGINESVTSPTSDGSGVQYVCTGWIGSGDVPGSGSASSVTFTITQPSSITWNWKTQYYLTVVSAYDSPNPVSGWFDSGSGITESVTSPVSGGLGTQYVCVGWTGSGSVPSSGTTSSITFTISAPSTITWNWKTQYYLTVSSSYDSPTPLSGWFDSGTSITESVTSPVSGPSKTQYVCTGWSGSGSVPGSGSGTTVYFNLSQPSSITWNWKTQSMPPLLPPGLVTASVMALGLLGAFVLLVFLEIDWIMNGRKTKKGARSRALHNLSLSR